MKNLSLSLLTALALSTLFSCQSSPSIKLVDNGQSEYTINILEQATKSEIKAAEVLQNYLQQISGAELAIMKGQTEGKKIVIGQIGEAENTQESTISYSVTNEDVLIQGGSPERFWGEFE